LDDPTCTPNQDYPRFRISCSRSLWSRGNTHACDCRFLQVSLQIPSWSPYCFRQESPEVVSSAHLGGNVSTTSPPLSSVVSPSSPSVAPLPPPLHRPHRTTMLSLGHARRIRRFLFPRTPHPLLFLPRTPPPPPPPLRTPCKSRCTHVLFFPSMCSTSIPAPPTSPKIVCLCSHKKSEASQPGPCPGGRLVLFEGLRFRRPGKRDPTSCLAPHPRSFHRARTRQGAGARTHRGACARARRGTRQRAR